MIKDHTPHADHERLARLERLERRYDDMVEDLRVALCVGDEAAERVALAILAGRIRHVAVVNVVIDVPLITVTSSQVPAAPSRDAHMQVFGCDRTGWTGPGGAR